MNDFLHWLGFGATVISGSFWALPINIAATATILLTSFIRVVHTKFNQGFADALWHFCFTAVIAVAFIAGVTGSKNPEHVIQTLLILMAVRGVLKVTGTIKPSK